MTERGTRTRPPCTAVVEGLPATVPFVAPEAVAYRDDRNDLDALADVAAHAGARLLYLANPDNPTGTWHGARDLRDFVERLPEGLLLLLDEAYAEFAPADALPPVEPDDPRL